MGRSQPQNGLRPVTLAPRVMHRPQNKSRCAKTAQFIHLNTPTLLAVHKDKTSGRVDGCQLNIQQLRTTHAKHRGPAHEEQFHRSPAGVCTLAARPLLGLLLCFENWSNLDEYQKRMLPLCCLATKLSGGPDPCHLDNKARSQFLDDGETSPKKTPLMVRLGLNVTIRR